MDIRAFFGNGPFAKPVQLPDWRLSHKFYLNTGAMEYEFFDTYLAKYASNKLIQLINKQKKQYPDEMTEYYSFTWKDGSYTYAEIWFIEEIPLLVSHISGSSPYAGNTSYMHREYDDSEIGEEEYQHKVEYTIDEICNGGKYTSPFAPTYNKSIRQHLLKALDNMKKYN